MPCVYHAPVLQALEARTDSMTQEFPRVFVCACVVKKPKTHTGQEYSGAESTVVGGHTSGSDFAHTAAAPDSGQGHRPIDER